jgi:hypothetical protein
VLGNRRSLVALPVFSVPQAGFLLIGAAGQDLVPLVGAAEPVIDLVGSRLL